MPRLLLLKGKLGPFEADAGWQHLVRQLFHPVQRGAGRNARRRDAHHFGGGEQIVAGHAVGRVFGFQPRHRADRHHLARRVARFQPRDVLRVLPETAVGLRDHLVGAAEIVEVVDILRAEIDLQRVEDVGRRQPDLLGLLAIDIGVDRRRARAEQREYAGEARILVGGGDQRLRGFRRAPRSRGRRDPAASS